MKTSVALFVLIFGNPFLVTNNWEAFKSYWYSGTAEISSYDLVQARYGELRKGEAVMIFVTEDFSKSKQVKLDNSKKNPSDVKSVLKLNMTRKFNTGIYPYSMMTAIFSPVDLNTLQNPIKITCSSQEWCGHTFSQLNAREGKYELDQKSYFETEGDLKEKVKFTTTEDGIWNTIRMNPELLPQGEFEMIPSMVITRLLHIDVEPMSVRGSLFKSRTTAGQMVYELQFLEFDRKRTIYFQSQFPYIIEGWEDTYKSGFGPNARQLTSSAKRKKTLKVDYWNKNKEQDTLLRKQLELN
ncbi:MAG: hypothetical protein ACI8P7_000526 [Candidatus Azotimanducaceae bacterium]|jgi:hypothetical protein